MLHPRQLLFFMLVLCPLWSLAQHTIHGRIVDDRSLEPLAFVHVLADGAREGTTSDIDGRFRLQVYATPAVLRFSYVGYAPLEIEATAEGAMLVRMHRTAVELNTVEVLPGENPAHRIIHQVYANRKENDGLRNRSHRYTSYSKTIFTVAMDSAILHDPERLALLDSSDRNMIDLLERQHLLLIESATAKSFRPPAAEKEEVLAMRVSGFEDPSLLALAASTRTFSVYEPQIVLNEKNYLSPIGPASTDRYLFLLKDTLYQGQDTVFVISYQPRRGKKFDALKGSLYVNSDGYALQNVIAEPVERGSGVSIKLQQQFEKVNGRAWFPVQLNTFLYLDVVNINTWKLIGVGRTFLTGIELDAEVHRKELRGPELVMEHNAIRRDEDLFASLRNVPLDERELNTYHVMDSLGKAHDLDKKLKLLGILARGRLPMGPVDLRLDQLFRYTGYEGVRLGAGLATNEKVSRYASVGGYLAYGFADEAFKYGGELKLTPRPGRELEVRGYYENDVAESGGVSYPGQRMSFNSEWNRWWFVERMDRVERLGGEISFRVNSSLKLWLGTERGEWRNLMGYRYMERLTEDISVGRSQFSAGAFSATVRFAFREQLMRLPDRQITLGTRWPVLYVQGYKAVPGLWQGEEDLWRLHFMLEKTFRLRMVGDLSVRTIGGMAQGGSPYAFLFNLRGTYDTRAAFAVQNTFEVMRPNEFLADRYVGVHLRHSFGNLLFKGKKWRPVPVLVANAAWGTMEHAERHEGYSFTTLGSGYYEVGLQLDALLRTNFTGLGVGVFRRVGTHQFTKEMDNLAIKITFSMGR